MMFHKELRLFIVLFLFMAFTLYSGTLVNAQDLDDQTMEYQLPPTEIVDLIDSPVFPTYDISPDKEWLFLMQRESFSRISDLAEDELRLAGIRITPKRSCRSRPRLYRKPELINISSGEQYPLGSLPADSFFLDSRWAPDSRKIAFSQYTEAGILLWIYDLESKSARVINSLHLSNVFGWSYTWMPDSQALLCRTVPSAWTQLSLKSRTPRGPVIRVNEGKAAPARTYQDLLKNSDDAELFEHYATAQMVIVTGDGIVRSIGDPDWHMWIDPSPDGKYFLVETLRKPFSYLVPYYRFARRVEVWNVDGNLVKEIDDRNAIENMSIDFDAAYPGPRYHYWHPFKPATVLFAEALDGGDPAKPADKRDSLRAIDAPFNDGPDTIIELESRFSGISWASENLAIITERWWKTRMQKMWLLDTKGRRIQSTLFQEFSWEDSYHHPGSPLETISNKGKDVLLTSSDGKYFYMAGAGNSPNGQHPFLDRYSFKSLKKKRLWQNADPYYEFPLTVLESSKGSILLRRETQNDFPNFFRYSIKKKNYNPLSDLPHPYPHMRNIQTKLIKYKRADGLDLTAKLYLPQNYDAAKDGPLPMIMWAYPQNFLSSASAGQTRDSENRFIYLSWWSPIIWVTQGYAVLDDPAMPIVAKDDKKPNDTFIEQLTANAEAAVKTVVEMGVTEPGKIAIGGHSYGAFMVAHLLAHTNLFATGIAQSGAYNRTLTPFGFQSEERTLWDDPQLYMTISPFMHADKINEPILLMHGQADNNPGTFPLQSERFFHALKGNGATVRLVLFPLESHGYRARESVMHQKWEVFTWLEKYVKRTKKEENSND